MTSTSPKALIRSPRREHGRQVGYDIFHVTGQEVHGGEVYLTLRAAGWVRRKDLLPLGQRGTLDPGAAQEVPHGPAFE